MHGSLGSRESSIVAASFPKSGFLPARGELGSSAMLGVVRPDGENTTDERRSVQAAGVSGR